MLRAFLDKIAVITLPEVPDISMLFCINETKGKIMAPISQLDLADNERKVTSDWGNRNLTDCNKAMVHD